MNNIKNNKIFLSLGILAFLAFSAISMPQRASANSNTGGFVNSYNDNGRIDAGVNTTSYDSTIFTNPAPAPARTVNTNRSQTVVSPAPTPLPAPEQTIINEPAPASDLSANALSAAKGFTLSLIQWIFFAILILIAVILIRKIFGGDKKYHASPMKHI